MKKILALIVMAVALGSSLGGCIVVPGGGGWHDHYHDHY
jgi:hypothetical protein